MFRILNKTKNLALDLLLPARCVGCGREGGYVCDLCEVFLGESINDVDGLVSIWEYEGIVKKMIDRIKYDGRIDIINELVERAFGVMIKDPARFQSFLRFLIDPDTYITYVPMDRKKERQRGFNQAELIAKKVGEISKKEVLPLLAKIKNNSSQDDVAEEERAENVKDVFQSRGGLAHSRKVVLVDDFLVSGATLRECSKILRNSGVENIWRFTLARWI